MNLKEYIRSIPDFPVKGIIFKDITTLLKDPSAIRETAKQLLAFTERLSVNKVVGIESRGFIFGSLLAKELNAGFVPVRKSGKLPAEKEFEEYALEYGTDKIEIHKDSINNGDKVLLHDDLLATGGTAEAACKLIQKLGGEIVQISFVMELMFLNGRERLKNFDVRSLIKYDSEN